MDTVGQRQVNNNNKKYLQRNDSPRDSLEEIVDYPKNTTEVIN